MSLGRAWSVSLAGVVGNLVEVECDQAMGLPGFTITGLPDASVTESANRVRAAVVNSGESWPSRRLTIGLSPATLPKVGSGFDIAIALAVLAADGQLPAEAVSRLVAVGELGLDGRIKHVRGVLPAVAAAVEAGHSEVVVAVEDAEEAGLVPGVVVRAAEHLRQLIGWLRGVDCLPDVVSRSGVQDPERRLDLSDVTGTSCGSIGSGSRSRRRTSSVDGRSAGVRQDDVGRTAARDFAPAGPCPTTRGHRSSLGSR